MKAKQQLIEDGDYEISNDMLNAESIMITINDFDQEDDEDLSSKIDISIFNEELIKSFIENEMPIQEEDEE